MQSSFRTTLYWTQTKGGVWELPALQAIYQECADSTALGKHFLKKGVSIKFQYSSAFVVRRTTLLLLLLLFRSETSSNGLHKHIKPTLLTLL